MQSEVSSIDASQWPILLIKIVANDDLDFLQRNFEIVADLYKTRKEPYVTVVDTSSGHRPSPAHRYLQTEFRRQYKDHVKKYSRGTAIVVKSEIIKAVVTAIYWIKPPDTETAFFTDMDSAMEWARERLDL